MKTIKITKDQVKTQKDAIKWHLKNYGHITSWVRFSVFQKNKTKTFFLFFIFFAVVFAQPIISNFSFVKILA